MSTVIAGWNQVTEALRSERGVERLYIGDWLRGRRLEALVELANRRGIVVSRAPREVLDEKAAGIRHQGVVAIAAELEYLSIGELLDRTRQLAEPAFLIVLDGIEDPRNLGAILRTAEAAGVHGVVVPKRRNAPVTPVVERTSAGATAFVPIARVPGAASAVQAITAEGIWVVGADPAASQAFYNADFTGPVALAIGGEHTGLSRLVRERCDLLVKIPLRGRIGSLNASVAAGILMYEVVRQRQGAGAR